MFIINNRVVGEFILLIKTKNKKKVKSYSAKRNRKSERKRLEMRALLMADDSNGISYELQLQCQNVSSPFHEQALAI